ncbi:hypothetical protein JCM10212_006631 [Sporobolomyces blumeae]
MACTCRTALVLTRSTAIASRPIASTRSLRPFSRSSLVSGPAAAPSPAAEPSTSPASTSAASAPASLSSCPEGTVLKGLNYLKDESPITAKADSEYPAWLWSLATSTTSGSSASSSSSGGAAPGGQKAKGKGKAQAKGDKKQDEAANLRKQKKALKHEGKVGIKAANALKG